MIYSPGAVANYFLEKAWSSSQQITPMHLQKLTYFASGWYMALHDNEKTIKPLINEPLQAWEYGPVCSSIYHEFKGFGSNPIAKNYLMKELVVSDDLQNVEIKTMTIPKDHKEIRELLNSVWDRYASSSASNLSAMTHFNDKHNPWRLAQEESKNEGIVRGKEISNSHIKKYFKKLLSEGRAF